MEFEYFFGIVLVIEEINQLGGVFGWFLVLVVYDFKGDIMEYCKLVMCLLLEDEINVVFGCLCLFSCKVVLLVIECNNVLLWYCFFYEGFEYLFNVIYIGVVLNQNSVQLVVYLMQNKCICFFLVGIDYIYLCEFNCVMCDMVEQYGGEILDEIYLLLEVGWGELEEVLIDIKVVQFDVVFLMLVG